MPDNFQLFGYKTAHLNSRTRLTNQWTRGETATLLLRRPLNFSLRTSVSPASSQPFDAFFMIHRHSYIENLKTKYAEQLQACLGKPLISAMRRFYKFEDIEVSHPDTAEVVLVFDAPEITLYFSWEQFDDEFDLSVGEKSHLIDNQFSETQAEDDNILSKSLGKIFTLFGLYEDKFGSTLAALLRFENESFVVAVGHSEPPNLDEQTEEFLNFYGDDFYLWTTAEFTAALQKHNLEVAVRSEAKKSL